MCKEKSYFGLSGVQLVAILLVIGAGVVCALTGCESLVTKAKERNYDLVIATQFATLKYCEGEDNRIDSDKAHRVYERAEKIQGYIDKSASMTVADLEAYLVDQVPWETYSPADALAARAFITFLGDELEAKATIVDTNGQIVQRAEDVRVVAAFIVETVTSTLEPYL
jgi:hypothetical protein